MRPLAKDARELIHRTEPEAAQPVKDASLIVQEVLALQCCIEARDKSAAAFDEALIHVFKRNLELSVKAHFHLCRACVVRLGSDRGAFQVAAPRIFGPLGDTQLTQLFAAYSTASGCR